jgi:hypothetical protein
MPLPRYTGLSGDVFQVSAGLQILAYERLWLKEDLSAPFQKKNGVGKKGKKVSMIPSVNRYNDLEKSI